MFSNWSNILTAAQLSQWHADLAYFGQSWADKAQEFYETRTAGQLSSAAHGAWLCNDREAYIINRSFMAKLFPVEFAARYEDQVSAA